jgi:hypothetical protein
MAVAVVAPLACGVDPGDGERGVEGPVGQVSSPAIIHDLSHKISTVNSGAPYIQECETAGVPVPEIIADPTDPRWINHGEVANEFLSASLEAELWSYEDPSIDGVCAALPRWADGTAVLYGVICLSRTTSQICFWDNPRDVYFPRYQGTPITQFVGGYDLLANDQGDCSDCHAGENPFVVHPNYPAFADFRQTRNLTPNAWPRPIVPAEYPGNPGPLDQLGPVPTGEVPCDGCHTVGTGIRLPLVSNALPGFCSVVLGQATGGPKQTMPQGGGNGATHTNWLLSLCGSEPITGTTVPIEGFEPDVLSSPIIGPVFTCATQVMVKGLVYGAALSFKVDGSPISVPATAPGPQMVVDVGTPFEEGQTITVEQIKNGLLSDSAETTVQNHEDLYPDGLPAPVIVPAPLFTCARSIAVAHVPGATLAIDKLNGGTPVTTYTLESPVSHTWVGLYTEPAFVLGDSFKVKQWFCENGEPSPYSDEVAVTPAPTVFDAPAFVPGLIAGQQVVDIGLIVQGARVRVDWGTTPVIDELSVALNHWPNVDLAAALGSSVTTSHQLDLSQTVCGVMERANIVVQQCDPGALVAQIAPPVEGDQFVIVTQAVPGATIHVISAESLEHIGSGSGAVIPLIRPLEGGEYIQVIEELPGCLGTNAYQIQVLDL